MSDDGYEGIPCPVPNCQGYLRLAKPNARDDEQDDQVVCEYGHLVERVSGQ